MSRGTHRDLGSLRPSPFLFDGSVYRMSALRREYKPRPPRPYRNRLGLSGGTSVDRRSGGTPDPRPGPGLEQAGDPSDFCRFLVLWHGCTSWDRHAIQSNPSVLIDPRKGREAADSARVYTTTYKRQTRHWAWKRYYDIPARKWAPGRPPATGGPEVSAQIGGSGPQGIAPLRARRLDNERFWSLVQYCRQSTADRRGPTFTLRDPTAGMIS